MFVRLASLPGMSHIRLLYGDFVGCAMGSNVSIPHLANWRTGVTYALEKLPDENVSLFSIVIYLEQNFINFDRAAVWQCRSG